jgi:hypothetical protein
LDAVQVSIGVKNPLSGRFCALAIALHRKLRLYAGGWGISDMRNLGIMALGVAAVLSVTTTQAAMANCSDATDSYNSAISDVSDALKRYTRCLSSSNGHDDCSSEFRKLKNAQAGFESAVSEYESECN